MLSIMSGARRGEILGLKWSEVDFFNNQIRIRRTFNSGRWYKPKTKTSRREIDLGPKMMNQLKRWRLACPANELGLVFPDERGLPIEPTKLLKHHFHSALEKAEVESIRIHDLRHTYASLQILNGENIKYIQRQMGHANPTVTLNVYAHLMDSVNQEAACRLENTVFGAQKNRTGSKMVADEGRGK
jgi:integrase